MSESDNQGIGDLEELEIFNHVHNSLIIGLYKILKDKRIVSGDEIGRLINEQKAATEQIFAEQDDDGDADHLKNVTLRLFDKFEDEIRKA